MLSGFLGRAFAAAHHGYFLAGFHMARALSDHQFLSLAGRSVESPTLRRLGDLWEKARNPLQTMVVNKWTDTVLKSDFSPRPTGDVMKKIAAPLLRLIPQMLPRLLSAPALTVTLAAAGLILLDPSIRSAIAEQATHLMAPFAAQGGDAAQSLSERKETGRALTPDVRP